MSEASFALRSWAPKLSLLLDELDDLRLDRRVERPREKLKHILPAAKVRHEVHGGEHRLDGQELDELVEELALALAEVARRPRLPREDTEVDELGRRRRRRLHLLDAILERVRRHAADKLGEEIEDRVPGRLVLERAVLAADERGAVVESGDEGGHFA